MTLLQSQLDRFDEKFCDDSGKWLDTIITPESVKEHLASCDKERLMWVVEQLDKLEWHSEFENPEFRKASELGWARFKLDFSSLIKKEIGVTE